MYLCTTVPLRYTLLYVFTLASNPYLVYANVHCLQHVLPSYILDAYTS